MPRGFLPGRLEAEEGVYGVRGGGGGAATTTLTPPPPSTHPTERKQILLFSWKIKNINNAKNRLFKNTGFFLALLKKWSIKF